MHAKDPRASGFTLRLNSAAPRRPVLASLLSIFGSSAGLEVLRTLQREAPQFADPCRFAEAALERLRVQLKVAPGLERRIPESGPLVVVANHPFGGLDGLAAIALIGRRRRDIRLLANRELARLDTIGELMLPVDPYGGRSARHRNAAAMRQALRWVNDGGVLLVFPAGAVSHIDLRAGSITDPPWSATAARLVRLCGAPVVPMHFSGANSALFQLAGLVNPGLRTWLLPHELANKQGARVVCRIGEPLDPARFRAFESDDALAAHLRLRTYLLARAPARIATARTPRALQPIAEPVDPEVLTREIDALPAETLLLESGGLQVRCAGAHELRVALREIGRLRETTFRAVGEGTGRSLDIDEFDAHYEHLFVWNPATREIVGGYRVGRIDCIRRRFGRRGLYTSTLFDYREPFLTLLGPALELGRSFVRIEHQKSFAPLLLLWKGIGALVAREPFRGRFSLRALGSDIAMLANLDTVSTLVADLEPDGKGVPVLLRQYLRLGGRLLGFNVDAAFGDSLDCLMLVDLRRTNPKVLQKYIAGEVVRRLKTGHRLQSWRGDSFPGRR